MLRKEYPDKRRSGGLDLTWGNSDAIIRLAEMMVERKGIGDMLADGSKKAAEKSVMEARNSQSQQAARNCRCTTAGITRIRAFISVSNQRQGDIQSALSLHMKCISFGSGLQGCQSLSIFITRTLSILQMKERQRWARPAVTI